VVAQIVALQVRLLACRERLAADTDSEALHDLRTTLRRLRSLLRPLRGLPGVEQLEEAPRRWVPSPRRCATVRCWRPN
jgi:CHAD domain-containing protein